MSGIQYPYYPGYNVSTEVTNDVQKLIITDANAHSLPSARRIIGLVNLYEFGQLGIITGWDSASGAFGPIAMRTALPGPELPFPGDGIPLTFGLTVQADQAPQGDGFMVLWA